MPRKFQALIGTVETFEAFVPGTRFHQFQALIGTVETGNRLPYVCLIAKFQALIGTVETSKWEHRPSLLTGFKPS